MLFLGREENANIRKEQLEKQSYIYSTISLKHKAKINKQTKNKKNQPWVKWLFWTLYQEMRQLFSKYLLLLLLRGSLDINPGSIFQGVQYLLILEKIVQHWASSSLADELDDWFDCTKWTSSFFCHLWNCCMGTKKLGEKHWALEGGLFRNIRIFSLECSWILNAFEHRPIESIP